MPRGVKKQINYSEEIERINMRIIHHNNSIKELEEKRDILISQKNEKDMNSLMSFLQQNNLSAEDLLNQLSTQVIPQTA